MIQRKVFIVSLMAVFAATSFAQSQASVDPTLVKLAKKNPGASVKAIVFLKNQPGPQIGESFRSEFEPMIEGCAAQLRAIHALQVPARPLSKKEEAEISKRLMASGMSPLEQAISLEMDAHTNRMVKQISDALLTATEDDFRVMGEVVNANGGQITDRLTVVNGFIATIPARAALTLGDDSRIALISASNPGFAELNVSAPTIGANTFWAGGFTGGGFDVGVLDTGVQQNHPAFAGHTFESNAGTTDSDGHGTAMAGIMASTDATNRGIAPGAGTICVAAAGADAASMTGMNYLVTGTTEKPEAINYSFGNGTANVNDYAPIDQFFDAVVDTFGIMVSKSTGNNGFGTGSPTITHPAPAYNLMASANMNDNNTTSRTDDRINSSSSRGPTVAGRKKPDITSPGTNIVSPTRTGGWAGITGTSPASPHTGGSIVLLKHKGVADVRAAKAILLNNTDAINDAGTSATTDDTWVNGSLWNRRYGWGYINLSRAYLHAADYFTGIFPAPPTGGKRFQLYKGSMLQYDKATLVWNRHVSYGGGTYPTLVEALSNLNLTCYDQATNATSATSNSAIDNVEQLHAPANGNYVLKVDTAGAFDPQVSNEIFALATEEGFTLANGPQFDVRVLQADDNTPNSIGMMSIVIKNTGDLPAFNVTAGLELMPIVGAPTQNLGLILPGQTKAVNFLIQLPPFAGDFLIYSPVSSSSYGETFSALGEGSYQINHGG